MEKELKEIISFYDLDCFFQQNYQSIRELLIDLGYKKHHVSERNAEFQQLRGQFSVELWNVRGLQGQLLSDINMFSGENIHYDYDFADLFSRLNAIVFKINAQVVGFRRDLECCTIRKKQNQELYLAEIGDHHYKKYTFWKNEINIINQELQDSIDELHHFQNRLLDNIDFVVDIIQRLDQEEDDDDQEEEDDEEDIRQREQNLIDFLMQPQQQQQPHKKTPLLSVKTNVCTLTTLECVLCYTTLPLTTFSSFSCEHSFCTHCISQHLQSSSSYDEKTPYYSCPLCRQEISEIRIHYHHDIHSSEHFVLTSSILAEYCVLKLSTI